MSLLPLGSRLLFGSPVGGFLMCSVSCPCASLQRRRDPPSWPHGHPEGGPQRPLGARILDLCCRLCTEADDVWICSRIHTQAPLHGMITQPLDRSSRIGTAHKPDGERRVLSLARFPSGSGTAPGRWDTQPWSDVCPHILRTCSFGQNSVLWNSL